ncbi:MAG: potassium channel family protein [Candidatus Brocadiia bacterium]
MDGETLIATDRVDRETDFTGVALDSARVEPGLKQLLEYDIRRKRWREWYGRHRLLALPVWLFWLMCDYGHSTWRILIAFAVLALAFAAAYTLLPQCVVVSAAGHRHGLVDFGHALYFSVVTMTTLGFGDVYADPRSHLGQFLLSFQVTLGYVLLGALVTRLAVLFTAGGPAAPFYREAGSSRSS